MIAYLARRHVAHPVVALIVLPLLIVFAFVEPSDAFMAGFLLAMLVVLSWRLPFGGTTFEAALPIRGREVVMARALATLALVLVPATVWIGASLLRGSARVPLTTMVDLTALAALGTLLPCAVRGGSVGAPSLGRTVLAGGALAAAGIGAMRLLPPVAATSALLLSVAAMLVVIWMTVPDALQVAGMSPSPSHERSAPVAREIQAESARRTTTPVDRRWYWPALRSALPGQMLMFYLLLIFAGAIGRPLTFFAIALLAGMGATRLRTGWLAAFPFSHRTRLLAIVVPTVVVSVCCVGLGELVGDAVVHRRAWLTSDAPSTSTPDHYFSSPTALSIDHWRRANGAWPPAILAPWGERAAADTATLLGVRLYNPYSSGEGSSPRFVEWQFERATAAVYGRSLTQAQYDTASVLPSRDRGDVRLWLVDGAALMTFGLLVLLLAETGYSRRWRPGSRMPVVMQWVAALPIFAAIILSVAIRVRDADVANPLLHALLRAAAHALPTNPAAALAIAAVPVLAAYALLERQFGRSEPAISGASPGANRAH